MKGRRQLVIAGFVALLAVGCDQGTKLHAVVGLTDAASSVQGSTLSRAARAIAARHPKPISVRSVIPGYWDFEYAENRGSAFSFLRDSRSPLRLPFLLTASILGSASLAWFIWRARDRWTVLGAAIALGGAIGNAIDRARLGYVIDFVHWHLGGAYSWPIFNVADVLIAVGMGLLLLRAGRRSKATA